MGSATSRLQSPLPTPPVNRTNRFTFSSLLCGASTSHSTPQMEEYPTELQVESAAEFDDEIQKVTEESSCTGARISCSSHAETAISSDTITELGGNITVEGSSRNVATSSQRRYFSECKELVPPPRVCADHSRHESYRDSSNTASTSFVQQQSSNPVSVNVSANKDAVNNIGNSVDSGNTQISRETMHQEHGDSRSVTSQLPEDEASQETIPSGLGFLVSNRETGQGNESVLHVDVVAISSNMLSGSNAGDIDHDARRNGRRLFWDAFSHSSRWFGDSPTIVFSTGDADDPGSQDRWLLGLGGDFSNGVGSRIWQHSRSEIRERLRGSLDENGRRNSSCPLGLHADGICSCESFPVDEESSTRARISRIVMLAQVLFEVLNEIHRQPASLSLSMVSHPAPESIVDSFPLKSHKKVDADGSSDTEQCYICLAEYEEGDQIRVLPCNHEYHMSCVDKWLKEIHGVCPVCRGNVCGGFTESSASNTEVPSY